ncbi:MAG: hypothetical protein AAGC60_22300 [Acidobacteriota bacterium]
MCCDPRRRDSRSSVAPLLAFVLLLTVAVSTGGCGKKGDPLPPLRSTPQPTKDLSVRQEGSLLMLELTYPRTTVGGQPLDGVDTVELWRLRQDARDDGEMPQVDARQFQGGAEQLMTLSGSELEGSIVGDSIQLKLPIELAETPQAETYGVRTTKGIEASVFSNLATVMPVASPTPPANLALEARAAGVVVTWEAAEDPEAFDVFRRRATERGYEGRLRRVPGDVRRMVDRTASYGERYIYTLRTVVDSDPLVYSDPAGEREVTYEDRFAPPLPANLVALPERGAVRLRWDASDADDVAGYILYRRNPGRDDFVPITSEPVIGEEYFDGNLASGLEFAYRIQVVDIRDNESSLSPPVAATTR